MLIIWQAGCIDKESPEGKSMVIMMLLLTAILLKLFFSIFQSIFSLKVRDEIEQLMDDDGDMAEIYLTEKIECCFLFLIVA